ncbi:hypothetical protein [uncultured Megasphaera sp.]|uniref:hypothetical protein n=1 Tax=uncultured Megasphaera sp. TaxID=165188 RepID=UPI00266C2F9D|nr:hypothetical protein [uncultured Megasphaera sp.]
MKNQNIQAQFYEKCKDLQDFAKRNDYTNLIVFTPKIDIEKFQQQGDGKGRTTLSVSVNGNLLEVYCMMYAVLISMADNTSLPLNTLIDEFSRFCYERDFRIAERS